MNPEKACPGLDPGWVPVFGEDHAPAKTGRRIAPTRYRSAGGNAAMNDTTVTADLFVRAPLPKRFCNLDRLLFAVAARGLDGIVATAPWNVFYLSGFNAIAHKSDEPRPYAIILSRHAPEHPVMVLADYYLATFLTQPSWVEDLRPFRAVMMPLDLPAQKSDIDRFIPREATAPWLANAPGMKR